MKRIIAVCVALAASSTLTMHAQQVPVTGQPTFWITRPIEGRVVKGAPYSAEIVTESVQTLVDGNRIVQRTTGRVYRDSEGRVRREEDRASGGPSVSITDPVAGKSFGLDRAKRTARETPILALPAFRLNRLPQLAWLDRPGRGARGGDDTLEEKLPDRTIEGVIASGVRRTTTIAAGAIGNEQPIRIVSEEWTSPQLQVLVLTDLTDPRAGRSTYRLLKINRAEPDPALFRVPGDYTVERIPGRARGAPRR